PGKERRHPADEQRRRQHDADEDLAAQASLLLLACAPLAVLGLPAVDSRRGAQLVAGRLDSLLQPWHPSPCGIERHGRLLGGQIHVRALYAGHAGERALDLAHAGRAVHAAHRQGLALCRHHFPPKRANTSSSSSIFWWRSDFEPERSASVTQDSMWPPSSSF